MTPRSDYAAQGLMRDLRVLIGAEALLNAFEGGAAARDALVLTARHAESAAAYARLLVEEYQEKTAGQGSSAGAGGEC